MHRLALTATLLCQTNNLFAISRLKAAVAPGAGILVKSQRTL